MTNLFEGVTIMHHRRIIPILILLGTVIGVLSLGGMAFTQGNPRVVVLIPGNGQTNVKLNESVTATEIYFPPGDGNGVNAATLTSANVYLCPNPCAPNGSNKIDAALNTTGGNDAFTLVPRDLLLPLTTYQYVVTSGLRDLIGNSFEPFTATFTTGLDDGSGSTTATFTQIQTYNPSASDFTSNIKLRGKYASLAIGPDNRLYAALIAAQVGSTFYPGGIRIFDIRPDGLLEFKHEITTFSNRAVIGLEFDPDSTPTNPILWVTSNTHLIYPANNGNPPHFTGEIVRLTVNNHKQPNESWTSKVMVTGLPRSKKDHLANSLALGPDGAMYMVMGSQSAMGRVDGAWGNRPETSLAAAVLRIDIAALKALPANQLPYNVVTADPSLVGATTFDDSKNYSLNDSRAYDPNAAGALVTLYATGIRNAYDLVWHTNGNLYVPTNGSAAGGNTPAWFNSTACTKRANGQPYNGQTNIPALTGVSTQKDYLYRVVQGGYYGHPNPKRCEWVLNGGNSETTPNGTRITEYASGINPDPNFRGISWDFGLNKSPNGVIEYRSSVFSSALRGKLLVVRYSANDDILVLTPGANGDIVSEESGILGFSGFNNPLDLIEDRRNGNIYVSEYQNEQDFLAGRIVLLKPNTNRRPVADQDTYEVVMGNTLTVNAPGVLANDSDPEGSPLTARLITSPANAQNFQFNTNGSFTYTPKSGFKGTDIFTYRANDGQLDSNLASVTIVVTDGGPNQPPVANNDAYEVNEGMTLTVTAPNGVLVNDSDPNGDSLTAVLSNNENDGPFNGTVTLNSDGSFTYVPRPAFHGTDTFKYRADDGRGLRSAKATVTITVNPFNYPPTVSNETYYGVMDELLVRDVTRGVLANDTDLNLDTLTVSGWAQPHLGVLDLKPDGSFTYEPVAAQTYSTTFTYIVSDGRGGTGVGVATINIVEAPEEFETLFNGSFEEAAPNNAHRPRGWTGQRIFNDRIRCNANDPARFARDGVCGFRFAHDPAPTQGSFIQQFADTSNLKPGDVLTISAYVKATRIRRNSALIRVIVRYMDGTVDQHRLRFDEGTYAFRQFSMPLQLSTSKMVDTIRVRVIFNDKGTIGNFVVDNVSLWKEPAGTIPVDTFFGLPTPSAPETSDGILPLPPAADLRGTN